MSVDTLVRMTAAGCSVVVDLADGGLPAILHWGADLGPLTEQQLRAVSLARRRVGGHNEVDIPVRLALLPEHHTGYVGRPGLTGSRHGGSWSTKFRVVAATLDGEPLRSVADTGPGVLEVTAVDDEARLELAVTMELLPSGLLRSRARVTNRDAAAFQVDDLVLAYPVPPRAGELFDFAGRWGKERWPQRSPFDVGTRLREGRKGRTGPDAATVLHAGTKGFGFADGEVWGVHTAWSGNHIHYAERTFDGARVLGGGELLLSGEIQLSQGESYQTPWLYGSYGVGLDESARRFHRYLRSRPQHVSTHRPVTLNVWEAVYFDHDLDTLLSLAERASRLGVERYVLDDGWFGSRRDDTRGLGDWVVSDEVWPQGLHPLIDRVTALGMEFGLWVEPEMVNPDSDVARAHPEWIMAARREWPVESRHQQVINLSIPECYDYVLGRLRALLDEYDIGYFKWDHNRDLVEAGDQTRGHAPAVHAQTAALYRLLGELKAGYPGLEIESCSSGGARVDLGILELTDRVWVSDCIDPLERQQMMRWTGQLVPPEMLGAHIASDRSHTTGRMHDLSFRAATAVFGHLGIEWNLLDLTEPDMDELSAWTAFYRDRRDLLLGGDLVRMDDAGDDTFVHGVIAPDRSEALVAYVLVGYPVSMPGPAMRIRGLDPARTYQLQPLLVGAAPSGLVPPPWWGEAGPAGYPGAAFTGSLLEQIGVATPYLHPDQAVLFHLRAT